MGTFFNLYHRGTCYKGARALQLVDLSAESQLASEHVVKYGMVKIPAKAMVL